MRLHKLITAAVLTAVSLTYASAQKPTPSPSEKQRFEMAADYSRENRGVSVLVMKGDKIVFEDYQNGRTVDTDWILASGTKSFTGVLLAAAIEDKLIMSFDEKVSDTITEWKGDKRKEQITLRQLLTLTSGLYAGQIGRVPSYSDAVKSSSVYEPGTRFAYGPVPFQVFGEVLTRKLKPRNETVMSYLKRRILDPIGMKVGNWRMVDGQPLLPQGAYLTAREWAKFGLLLKDRGKWKGKQILSAKLLDELSGGTKTNPAYGISFWLNQTGGSGPGGRAIGGSARNSMKDGIANGVSDLFMAAGAGNQRLYVIRSLDVVIVRQGAFGEWDDREFLEILLAGKRSN
ncbi:MAG: serine hydrolase [Blastocatellia bacterium]|nr:serine hydrolase [Blastocatellia bacterium]